MASRSTLTALALAGSARAFVAPATRCRSPQTAHTVVVDPTLLADAPTAALDILRDPAVLADAPTLDILPPATYQDEVFASLGAVDMRIALLQAGASLFAAVFGFGDAIIAMPLLALLFGVEAVRAAPLVVSVSFCMSLANTSVDIQSGAQRAAGRWTTSLALLGGAVIGVPLGVRALVTVPPYAIRGCVGALLLAYGSLNLYVARAETGDAAPAAQDEGSLAALAVAFPFGLAAGFLGGAVAEPGPAAVVLGQARRWTPPTLRCMLLRFFLPVQVLSLMEFQKAGLIDAATAAQALVALPLVAVAVVGGTKINRTVDPDDFSEILAVLVLVLGCLCASSAYGDYEKMLGATQASSVLLS